jgi:hypothetical protein
MRQRRVVAGNGLSTGLSTAIKFMRRTASGAAGSGLGITIMFLRRTRNGARHGQVPETNNCHLICRVLFSCCDSVAWQQETIWAPA